MEFGWLREGFWGWVTLGSGVVAYHREAWKKAVFSMRSWYGALGWDVNRSLPRLLGLGHASGLGWRD